MALVIDVSLLHERVQDVEYGTIRNKQSPPTSS